MLFRLCPQGRREEDDVVEKLNLFLDLLQSYRVSRLHFVPQSFLLSIKETEISTSCFLMATQ